MRLAKVTPALGALPELWTFECRDCVEAVTETKDELFAAGNAGLANANCLKYPAA